MATRLTSNAYSSRVNTRYWSDTQTLSPSCSAHSNSRNIPVGHVSTALVTVRISHMETTLFCGSGGYVLTNVSLTNSSRAGASDSVSRWPSRRSAARVAEPPVGMCVLEMVPATWSSTRAVSAPSSSTRSMQHCSIVSHASRSCVLISHAFLSLPS